MSAETLQSFSVMWRAILFVGVLSVGAVGADARGRLLGGTEAKTLQFPYLVFLKVTKPNATFVCGGTLLDARRVLTAAHCLDGVRRPQDVTAVLGEHDFLALEGSEQTRVAEAFLQHHFYQGDFKLAADLAILEVLEPFLLDGQLRPATLGYEEPQTGTVCTAAGWGTTSEIGEVSPVLLMANLTIIERSHCKDAITAFSPTAIIDSSVFCAGGDGTRDTCEGDSGGPLVCGGLVVGMVSWGVGCGHKGLPGVYTSIPHWRAWITNHLRLAVTQPPPPVKSSTLGHPPSSTQPSATYLPPLSHRHYSTI